MRLPSETTTTATVSKTPAVVAVRNRSAWCRAALLHRNQIHWITATTAKPIDQGSNICAYRSCFSTAGSGPMMSASDFPAAIVTGTSAATPNALMGTTPPRRRLARGQNCASNNAITVNGTRTTTAWTNNGCSGNPKNSVKLFILLTRWIPVKSSLAQ